jgi:hypothetical protein
MYKYTNASEENKYEYSGWGLLGCDTTYPAWCHSPEHQNMKIRHALHELIFFNLKAMKMA